MSGDKFFDFNGAPTTWLVNRPNWLRALARPV